MCKLIFKQLKIFYCMFHNFTYNLSHRFLSHITEIKISLKQKSHSLSLSRVYFSDSREISPFKMFNTLLGIAPLAVNCLWWNFPDVFWKNVEWTVIRRLHKLRSVNDDKNFQALCSFEIPRRHNVIQQYIVNQLVITTAIKAISLAVQPYRKTCFPSNTISQSVCISIICKHSMK